jgi:methionine--tRNA ligase beta chain
MKQNSNLFLKKHFAKTEFLFNNFISKINNSLGTTSSEIDFFKINETSKTINNHTIYEIPEKMLNSKTENKTTEKNENKKNADGAGITTVTSTANITETEKVVKKDKKNEPSDKNLFAEVCLKVGKVVELKHLENSDKIYVLKIDVGEKELREIGTGLRKHVPENELLNSNVIVFANLKPKKLLTIISNGMVMSASTIDGVSVELIRPNVESKPGEICFLEGQDAPTKEPGDLSKNKFEKVLGKLSTNDSLHACFDG